MKNQGPLPFLFHEHVNGEKYARSFRITTTGWVMQNGCRAFRESWQEPCVFFLLKMALFERSACRSYIPLKHRIPPTWYIHDPASSFEISTSCRSALVVHIDESHWVSRCHDAYRFAWITICIKYILKRPRWIKSPSVTNSLQLCCCVSNGNVTYRANHLIGSVHATVSLSASVLLFLVHLGALSVAERFRLCQERSIPTPTVARPIQWLLCLPSVTASYSFRWKDLTAYGPSIWFARKDDSDSRRNTARNGFNAALTKRVFSNTVQSSFPLRTNH